MIEVLKKKKQASMIENMLVMMINMVVMCAFLVIIFGAFSGISDKWGMRQTAVHANHGNGRLSACSGSDSFDCRA